LRCAAVRYEFVIYSHAYKRWPYMLLALTGSTGFIGQHLLRELPKRGYRLRVLLRRPASVPMQTASAVIGDLARPQNMSAALEGVDAVIHSAGITRAMSGDPEDDYRMLNTEATIRLARAARRAGAKRFIFLSSIRAQCGPTADTVQRETDEPRPTDAYGESKLSAERGLAELDLDWVSLRAVLVYGLGVKGNMAQLMRLARSPYPLPLGSLGARRSLLALENLLAAIETVLVAPGTPRRAFIAADPKALTISEMIAAMRHGLGRRPNIISLPAALLQLILRAAGREEIYQRLDTPAARQPHELIAMRTKSMAFFALNLRMIPKIKLSILRFPTARDFAISLREAPLINSASTSASRRVKRTLSGNSVLIRLEAPFFSLRLLQISKASRTLCTAA